jgi:hypothetical protein
MCSRSGNRCGLGSQKESWLTRPIGGPASALPDLVIEQLDVEPHVLICRRDQEAEPRCEPQVGQDLRAAFDEVADMLRLEEVGRIRRDLACPQEPAGGRALAVATAVERPGARVQIRGYPSDGCGRSGQELRTSRLQLPPRRTTRSVSSMSARNTGHASFAGETLIIRQRPMGLTGQLSNASRPLEDLLSLGHLVRCAGAGVGES